MEEMMPPPIDNTQCLLHTQEIEQLKLAVEQLKRGKWETRLDIIAKASAPVCLLLIAWFMGWSQSIDRDVVRIDTNQKVVMGNITEMSAATRELADTVGSLSERISKLEGMRENENR